MPADIQMQLKRLGIHYERLAPPIETTEIAARRQATADRCPLVDVGTIPQSADGVMPHRARRLITLSTAATIADGVAGFAWITERHQPPTTDVGTAQQTAIQQRHRTVPIRRDRRHRRSELHQPARRRTGIPRRPHPTRSTAHRIRSAGRRYRCTRRINRRHRRRHRRRGDTDRCGITPEAMVGSMVSGRLPAVFGRTDIDALADPVVAASACGRIWDPPRTYPRTAQIALNAGGCPRTPAERHLSLHVTRLFVFPRDRTGRLDGAIPARDFARVVLLCLRCDRIRPRLRVVVVEVSHHLLGASSRSASFLPLILNVISIAAKIN